MTDDQSSKVHRFLKSDLFRNLTAAVACIFGGAALIVSLHTSSSNAEAQKQQTEFQKQQAAKSGDHLQVTNASLVLWNENKQQWTTHNAYMDGGQSVQISSDEWIASHGQRNFTVNLDNDGQQAAHIRLSYFMEDYIDDGRYHSFGDPTSLAPQCDWGTGKWDT